MCIVIMANMFRTDGYLDNLLMCTVYGCIQKFISTMYNPQKLCTDPFRNSSVQSVQDRKVIWSTAHSVNVFYPEYISCLTQNFNYYVLADVVKTVCPDVLTANF